MTEIRLARPDETGAVTDFINMVFSMAHEPHDFKRLMPKVYADDGCMPARHMIAVEDGRIKGCVGLLPLDVYVLGEKLKCGLVGSVSAHAYEHSKGYMKACMNAMLEDADRQGMQLLALGGARQRYEYFGFSHGGQSMDYELTKGNFKHAFDPAEGEGIEFVPIDEYIAECKRLHDAQPVHAERREKDFGTILRTWTAEPHAVLYKGEFIGYITGWDDNITEMTLSDEKYARAVVYARHDRTGKELSLTVPVWNTARIRTFNRVAENVHPGECEMFRLNDIAANIRLWLDLKASYTHIADGDVTLGLCGETLRISVRDGKADVTPSDGEPAAVFDRLGAQDLLLSPHRWVDTSPLPACVESWFPLPLTAFSADGY